jgi:hypothetical protein
MSDFEKPPFTEIIGEPWSFGQPEEAGNYEWWSLDHSIDVTQPTIFTGYDGNVNGWGRDVWYRKIPAKSSWRYAGWQTREPFRGSRCHAFMDVVDGVIHCKQLNFTPSFMESLNGTSFSVLVKTLLLKPNGDRLIRVHLAPVEVCEDTFDETADGT